MNAVARAASATARRDLVRWSRQPAQLAAVIGTPLVVWLLFSGLLGPAIPGNRGAAYLVPGAALLTALFSAATAGMALIEDRQEGWLRAALVSPAPRVGLALGKTAAATALATAQAAVILALGVLTAGRAEGFAWWTSLAAIALASAAAAGGSLAMAWNARSSRAFHGVINLVLVPAWLLSGALFPLDEAAPWARGVSMVNPLAWANTLCLGGADASGPAAAFRWLGLIAAAAVGIGAAALTLGRLRRSAADYNSA